MDDWLVIQVENPEFAIGWRAEAERKQREGGRPAMTEEEVRFGSQWVGSTWLVHVWYCPIQRLINS